MTTRTKAVIVGACVLAPLLGLAGLAAIYFAWVGRGVAAQQDRIDRKLSRVRADLAEGRPLNPATIDRLALDPEVRNTLYDDLARHGQQAVFPSEQRTFEAYAESDLVFWLGHPNELQGPPDEIELVRRATVSAPGLGDVDWFLFRFRVKAPHWASDEGWMAGASGPYFPDRLLEAQDPAGTWSEFESMGSRSPERHVESFHRRAREQGVYEHLAAGRR